jgi:hypothetical protein
MFFHRKLTDRCFVKIFYKGKIQSKRVNIKLGTLES